MIQEPAELRFMFPICINPKKSKYVKSFQLQLFSQR